MTTQPQTDEELAAELAKEKQRAELRERAGRPLVGTAGEYGTGDFLDQTAGQMSLFNFVQ